ncbi:MAG: SDR family oxidoreductase [Actinobacteria bacterium]|nr:SDR family oxidoreductase [Actinomycetota bacterium]
MRMQDAVVVVTGASAGIGRATARRFARAGAKVALLARGEESLGDLAKDLVREGATVLTVPTDVSNWEEVDAAATRIESELGPIDVWVNNAMTAVLGEVRLTSAEEFRRVMDVTYLGTVHGTLAALRRMEPRDRGVIVQVGSALSRRAIPLQASYCAGKHAIKGFTESLRVELRHQGSHVRTSIVQLPAHNTTQFGWVRVLGLAQHPQPVPPIFEPELAADAILWAAEHDRAELWVGWPTVKTILGSWLVPSYVDRYLARNGYGSQQMAERPLSPDRADYLTEPLDDDADYGAHGIFGDRARRRSTQLWLNLHRRAIGAAAAGATAVAAGLVHARR